jgi:imidazolonepropionase-like amidohydrolase
MGTSGCSRREALVGDRLVILDGATAFIDGALQPNVVIVLQENRITHVGSSGQFRYPPSATVLDLHGRYILPGLIDMHVHVPPGARAETVRALLAHGVTTFRSPGVFDTTVGVQLRRLLATGQLVGPRMIAGGDFINGEANRIPGMVVVHSAEEMRAEVRRQEALGVDWIKLYWDVPADLVAVAVTEAHARGVRVAGHMRITSWTEAAQAGIDMLEHSGADGPTWELIDDSTLRNRLRNQDPPRSASSGLAPSQFYRLWASAINLQSPRMDTLASLVVGHNVSVDPTLVAMQSLYFGDDLEVLQHLEPARMPAAVQSTWGPGWERINPFVANNPIGVAQDLTSGKAVLPIAMHIVRSLHERGVRLTTGSDVGMPWITPGVSLHREFALLHEAGISPADIIIMATRNGAEALGLLPEIGTIQAGKIADLVILRANPLEDIRNTRAIEAVYHNGRRYDPDSLLAGR